MESGGDDYAKIDANAEVMDTPYDRWVSSQGIDVFTGYFVENLFAIPLKWWERFGGYGILINLAGTGHMDDAFVLSIPPGANTKPQRHVFEELTYVLDGRGATTVDAGARSGLRRKEFCNWEA